MMKYNFELLNITTRWRHITIKRIFPRQFQVKDLVFRESATSMPTIAGKLKSP